MSYLDKNHNMTSTPDVHENMGMGEDLTVKRKPNSKKIFSERDYFPFSRQVSDMIIKSIVPDKPFHKQKFSAVKHMPFYRHLLRFKEICLFYDYKYKERYMTGEEIFTKSIVLGPQFAEEIGDLRKYSMRNAFNTLGFREEISKYPPIVESVDFIFDPCCLFPWENPDNKDYLLMCEPPKQINDEDLFDFNKILEKITKRDVSTLPRFDFLDYLNYFKDSKVLVEDGKSITNYEAHFRRYNQKIDHTDVFMFKRVFVYKFPNESRDCLECNLETLHTLGECDYYVREIYKNKKSIKFGQDLGSVQSEMWRLDAQNMYLMVDIKKCGLTFPRNLLLEFLKFLVGKYPQISCFYKVYEGYRKNPLFLGPSGEYLTMTNGVGLGMMNGLVTVAFYILFRVAKDRKIFSPFKPFGYFIGDDQMIVLQEWRNSTVEKKIFNNYIELLEGYGLEVHRKKPFMARVGQFCEIFTKTEIKTEKSLKQYWVLLNALTASTIVEAKQMFSSVYNKYWGLTKQDNAKALQVLLDFWGYEFTKDEIAYPYELGGWVKNIENGLNQYLKKLFEVDCPTSCKNLFVSYKEVKIEYKFWDKKLTKLKKTFKDNFLFQKRENFLSGKDPLEERISQLVENYVPMALNFNRNLKKVYYKKCLERRQKSFFSNKIPTDDELIKKVISQEYNNCSIPEQILIYEWKTPMLERNLSASYQEEDSDDRYRLLINSLYPELVRGPRKGSLMNIFDTVLNKTTLDKNWMKFSKFHESQYFFLIGKLLRFGKDTEKLYNDLVSRTTECENFTIGCKPSLEFQNLQEIALGDNVSSNSVIIIMEGVPFNWNYSNFLDEYKIYSDKEIFRWILEENNRSCLEIDFSTYDLDLQDFSEYLELFQANVSDTWYYDHDDAKSVIVEESETDVASGSGNPIGAVFSDFTAYVMSCGIARSDHPPQEQYFIPDEMIDENEEELLRLKSFSSTVYGDDEGEDAFAEDENMFGDDMWN